MVKLVNICDINGSVYCNKQYLPIILGVGFPSVTKTDNNRGKIKANAEVIS